MLHHNPNTTRKALEGIASALLMLIVTACGPDGFDSLDTPVTDEVLLTEFVPPADDEGGEETGGQGMGTGEMPPPDMPAEDDPAGWCCDCAALTAGGWGCEPVDSADECSGDDFVWCLDDEGYPSNCIGMC